MGPHEEWAAALPLEAQPTRRHLMALSFDKATA
jgi:hypothetical protein